MKLQSLKNALHDLGLEMTDFNQVAQNRELHRIHFIDKPNAVVATVSKQVPLRISTNHKSFNAFQHKETLLQLLLNFSSTPIEDRTETPVYDIFMKGVDATCNRLVYTKKTTTSHQKGQYFFGNHAHIEDNDYYQTVFTQNDIDAFPQPFKNMVKQEHLLLIPHRYKQT